MSFDVNAVRQKIVDTRFAGRVHHFDSVTSTNTLALEAAQAGAREAVWVADEQTAGRGRGSHNWHSAVGDGLYASALVRPPLPPNEALRISLATGLAAKAAIAEVTGANVDIRWPNDLLIGSKKCGGILVETAMTPEQDGSPAMLRYAVIGVGVNLNHAAFSEELADVATSLRIETGEIVSRERLLVALLQHLEREMTLLVRDRHGNNNARSLAERFAEASTWVRGKRVRVDEQGGYTGVTAGLDAQGFLKVEGDDGIQRTVLSGGVREVNEQ
ncbi:MAG: biotin--[acetyl-CoA-carboxylase] ligase [Acidobacteria bacterium]|nr:biotin--[acetyl-CoA-carboxylase] ligase [Acidobacteriota bacterium]